MKRIFRVTARLLDYLWVYSLLFSILDILSADIIYYLTTLLFLPLIYIPIEALSLSTFKSTLGKSLFGFRYHRRPSFKKSWRIACKKGFLIQPLFLPGINIIFIIFYFRELKKYPTNRWDQIDGQRIISGNLKWHAHFTSFLAALILSIFTFATEPVLDRGARFIGLESANFIQDFNLFNAGDWTKISPKDSSFSVFFPNSPELNETVHDVPNSAKKLHVIEYVHTSNETYRLTYTSIPSSWTFFGSSMVFKGAIKIVEEYGEGKVTEHKRCSHQRFPAIQYQGKGNNNYFKGKIILVKNTLYRIEVVSAKKPVGEQEEKIQKFFDSFYPKA